MIMDSLMVVAKYLKITILHNVFTMRHLAMKCFSNISAILLYERERERETIIR